MSSESESSFKSSTSLKDKIMSKQKKWINGGFPPIKYCPLNKNEKTDNKLKTKERFFSNAVKQNINIRQILSDTKKKPIIITESSNNDDLEVIDTV